jgi:transcriptional regulator with XRE-family HTH domain
MSKSNVIEQRALTQAAPIRTVDEEARTVEVVFTTGAEVPHWMNTAEGPRRVITRARLTAEAARLDRLNEGAPVLDGHMDLTARDVIGVVESARIEEGRRGVALLRFSRAEEVEPIWQKVREGTLRNVSMGFFVHEAEILSEPDGDGFREVWELVDWEPFELSMVAIGADPGARVQSGQVGPASMTITDKRKEGPMSQKLTQGASLAAALESAIADAVTDERSEDDVVSAMAEAAGIEPGTVRQILAGSINCPPLDRLEGFAEVLGVSLDGLIDAANSDGCTYDTAAQSAQTRGKSNMTTKSSTTAAPADDTAVRQQAAREERDRITAIRQAGTALHLDEAVIQSAIDDGTAVDAFRQSAIETYAQRAGADAGGAGTPAATQGAGIGGPRASVTADAGDRFRQGAMLGLMARGGLKGGERNEFTGMTLAELARQSLSVANVRQAFDRRTEMVGAAFVQSAGGHSTSDFANILANITGKAALIGWEEAQETFQVFTSTGTLTDFKPSKRVGTGVFSSLVEKEEGAEYKYGTMGDRGESIALATYGRMLKITREAIINDDLSLLTDAPRKMGRAARRTIGNLVYAVLTGNPDMSDGTALFHADHGNLAGSGGAPSVTTLGAGRAAMRTQKEGDAKALNIAPAYFIVPAALETLATQLMRSTFEPTANKGHALNPVSGMAEVVVDGRLDEASTTAWYLAASPAMHDTIEVAYLDGVQEPFIEQKEAWSTDGAELKVRIDAGVAPTDWRGLYKNAGA